MKQVFTPLCRERGAGGESRILEVCAGSIESIKAAYEGGAYRVELCSALSEDGLTPSVGMIRYAKSLDGLKVHVLIRPRCGDFVYTDDEVKCMEDDIRMCRELGVDGVVIGALTKDFDIDIETCKRLVNAAGSGNDINKMNITFHRAFDVCRNPEEALEQIIALGCNRLLTSGQASSALKGIPMLKKLVGQADGRIIIMPGAGVKEQNAAQILDETGAMEIHGSARSTRVFGRLETDANIVRKIVENINPIICLA